MNARVLKAAGGGFLAMYVLSFLWYAVIGMDYNNAQYGAVMRGQEEVSLVMIAIGYLLMALLLAYAYPMGYKGGSGMAEGMRFGIMMGLIVALPAALITSGVFKFPLTANLVNALYRVVEIGIGGMVIGQLYGMGAGSDMEEAPADADAPSAADESAGDG